MSSPGNAFSGFFTSTDDPNTQALIQALQGQQGFQPGTVAYGALSNGASSLLNRAVANQIQKQVQGQAFANARLNGAMGSTTPNMNPAYQNQVQMPAGLFGGDDQ